MQTTKRLPKYNLRELVYYTDKDGNTSPSKIYGVGNHKKHGFIYEILTYDFRRIWVAESSLESQAQIELY